jgi:ABC-2 type transport system permease protein
VQPARALARRTLAAARVRTISFALLLVAYAFANGAGYRKAYPTLADRLGFAQSFGTNTALRLFYGVPRHIETLGGYAAWRVGGVASLFVAFFGILGAVRVLRGEEELGRYEIVAAGALSRRAGFAARGAALAASIAALGLALFVGLIAGGLPVVGSAYLALAIVSAGAAYTGVGALASQLMPSGRGTLALAGSVLGVDFLLRVVADTAGLPALHWALPLGWVEELRAFAGERPAVLTLPALATLALLLLALAIEERRDLGLGLVLSRETRRPSGMGRRLLRTPALLALRSEWLSLAVWAGATGGFAFVLGTLSKSLASADLGTLRQQLNKFGAQGFGTAASVPGVYFLFFVLIVALYCCTQVGGMRSEEEAGRLETLFALGEGRITWLAGRLLLAVAGATLIAVAAGLGAALGAIAVGADVSLARLLGAGLNCLPASLLFLGAGALLIAAAPRLGAGGAFVLVCIAFVWELVGALLSAPAWLLGLSPFHQIGLVPASPFRAVPAAVMLAIGLLAGLVALAVFRGRDLAGA